LPRCLPQIVSGVILGACYAMGAAAPLIFTGAVIISKVPEDVMKPAMALPYHLYMLLTQGVSPENAYGTAFVMMMIVLVTNSLATWFTWRKKV
ncbi:MAG: phosphate ABC transporter, permease protein PstA, partial [Oscillospiraceae bacterium]|nr:phosphate ABC transporter, permease protein PstA [Oscillospiraceae bacterium]